jgi:hypothetical protein
MSSADSCGSIRKASRLTRLLVIINFALLSLLLGPGRSHEFDLALRRAGIEDVIGRSFQIWIVSSTILSTTAFAFTAYRKVKTSASDTALPSIRLDAVLLLAWWLAIIGFLAYGFMLGMGG